MVEPEREQRPLLEVRTLPYRGTRLPRWVRRADWVSEEKPRSSGAQILRALRPLYGSVLIALLGDLTASDNSAV